MLHLHAALKNQVIAADLSAEGKGLCGRIGKHTLDQIRRDFIRELRVGGCRAQGTGHRQDKTEICFVHGISGQGVQGPLSVSDPE